MLADPEFPPLLAGKAVGSYEDPFDIATAGAKAGRLGAGDLLWSRDEARASAAIVLEPDMSLEQAVVMGLVMMVAIGDALGAIGPPNLAITYRWPSTLLANGAAAGRTRLAWPEDGGGADIPAFLVVGFDLHIDRSGASEPGDDPTVTWLREEGCGDLDRTVIIEAISRHFLSWVDGFMTEGFGPAHELWWMRAEETENPMRYETNKRQGKSVVAGKALGLDENGNLLLRNDEGTVMVPYLEAVMSERGSA